MKQPLVLQCIFFLSLTCVSSFLRPFPPRIWENNTRLLPLWTPFEFKNSVNSLKGTIIDGEHLLHYKNKNNTPVLLFDNCPHQGAKLSKGKLIGNDITCPYHGFRFKNGKFIGVPNTLVNSTICVPRVPTLIKNDIVYFLPFADYFQDNAFLKLIPEPFVVPEELDPFFTKVSGKLLIEKHCDIVTSNILDMLHISFVHSFGNRNTPLPSKIDYQPLSDISGKTTFVYTSGDKSISKTIGQSNEVIVENEFHLPSTTVTRVTANKIVKTVVTRAMPVSENKTILFWEIHRNFFNENYIITRLGDILLDYLMKLTLKEDIDILKNVNEKYFNGVIKTKYDITIQKFLKAKLRFKQSSK